MTEKVVSSFGLSAYRVDNVAGFDEDVMRDYKDPNDSNLKSRLGSATKSAYTVHICVNNSFHAFILCTQSDMSNKLQDVTTIELCYEDMKDRKYKIRRKVASLKNIEKRIKRRYFVGIYNDVSEVALQCAALQASPNVYNVLLDDCVEFSKKFCKVLLTYTPNGNEIKNDVEKEIRKATASGFTAEKLSREIQSSGYWMNSFLGGSDISTFVASRKGNILLVVFIIVYPIVVSLLMSRK